MSTYEFTCPTCKAIEEKKKATKKASVAKVDIKRNAKLQTKEKPAKSEDASHSSLQTSKSKPTGKSSIVKKPAMPTKIVINNATTIGGKQP